MKICKPKRVNYRLISEDNGAYELLERALEWHGDLLQAKIALAWKLHTKEDKDGRIVLGRCVKVSPLNREFIPFDFVIVLNSDYWDRFAENQRLALLDHELCHAAEALTLDGEQITDEAGRKAWRCRKHDIEEFRSVVERHGLYKLDLERFAEAIRRSKKAPLLETIHVEVSHGGGQK